MDIPKIPMQALKEQVPEAIDLFAQSLDDVGVVIFTGNDPAMASSLYGSVKPFFRSSYRILMGSQGSVSYRYEKGLSLGRRSPRHVLEHTLCIGGDMLLVQSIFPHLVRNVRLSTETLSGLSLAIRDTLKELFPEDREAIEGIQRKQSFFTFEYPSKFLLRAYDTRMNMHSDPASTLSLPATQDGYVIETAQGERLVELEEDEIIFTPGINIERATEGKVKRMRHAVTFPEDEAEDLNSRLVALLSFLD